MNYLVQHDLEFFYNYNYIENVLRDVHQHILTIDFLSVDDEYLKLFIQLFRFYECNI
jgi:hypothetical protein